MGILNLPEDDDPQEIILGELDTYLLTLDSVEEYLRLGKEKWLAEQVKEGKSLVEIVNNNPYPTMSTLSIKDNNIEVDVFIENEVTPIDPRDV